jgi:hypothetical protein
MTLSPMASEVNTLAEFSQFLETLEAEVRTSNSPDRNIELSSFLRSIGAWVESYTRAHDGQLPGGRSTDTVDWGIAAFLLLAGWEYE